MSIVRTVEGGGQIFFCPGCKDVHQVNTAPGGPRWTYNGEPARPTFSPSILVTCDWRKSDSEMQNDVCHSFVREGQIQFLSDCTHDLAGKTVPLPEWPYAPEQFGGIVDAL